MALLLEQEVFSMDAKLLKAQINEITACRAKEWVRTKSALLQLKAVQWSAAKINLNIFSLRDFGVTDEESSITQVKLFSKNNWFLRLQDDGNISGTREQNNDEGIVKWICVFSRARGISQHVHYRTAFKSKESFKFEYYG